MKDAKEWVNDVRQADRDEYTHPGARLHVIRAIQADARESAWIKIDPKDPATLPDWELHRNVMVQHADGSFELFRDVYSFSELCRSLIEIGRLHVLPTHWQPITPPKE